MARQGRQIAPNVEAISFIVPRRTGDTPDEAAGVGDNAGHWKAKALFPSRQNIDKEGLL